MLEKIKNGFEIPWTYFSKHWTQVIVFLVDVIYYFSFFDQYLAKKQKKNQFFRVLVEKISNVKKIIFVLLEIFWGLGSD